MNFAMTYKTITTSPDASSELGAKIGRQLRGGETIELASDLGGGKTVMVKGLARGLGYTGDISSPTFTLSRVYKIKENLELHHYDFYRIDSGDIVAAELAEVVGDPEIVVAVEWAGNAGAAMPAERVKIQINKLSEAEREIIVTALSVKFNYIIEGLKL